MLWIGKGLSEGEGRKTVRMFSTAGLEKLEVDLILNLCRDDPILWDAFGERSKGMMKKSGLMNLQARWRTVQ